MTDLTTQNPDSTQPTPGVGQTGAPLSSPQAGTVAAPAPAAVVAESSSPATEVRPAWIPEKFWDAWKNKGQELPGRLDALEKFEALHGAIPAKPEDYKPDLGDIKLPEGRELDTANPRFTAFQKIAHEGGMSQDTFNKIIRMEAQAAVDATTKFNAGVEADKAKRLEMLGENGAARLEQVEKWVDVQYPKPEDAAQIKATLWTPLIVEMLEQVQKVLTNQGVLGFTQIGRDMAGRNELPDGYEGWTSLDKRTYQLNQLAQRNGQTP